ncbi:MAG: response regulator [Alphaproteobacteria bacterium]|nr:response regulator [Alphaproteobacteria bacterium]
MPISRRVMVLEDEPELLELLTVFLGGLGHTVCATPSSDEALAFIEAGGVDLAIVDVGAHGIKVTRAAASRNIPCIMMSGRPVIFEIGGLGEVMQKPLKLPDLRAKIEALMLRYRAPISKDEKIAGC